MISVKYAGDYIFDGSERQQISNRLLILQNQAMRESNNLLPLLLILIFLISFSTTRNLQQTPTSSTTLALNTPTKIIQSSNSQNYFQTTISSSSAENVLMITVSADIQAFVSIYVITSASDKFVEGQWPDWSLYSQECFYSSIDTCALRVAAGKDLVVYFTVMVGVDCQYVVDVTLQPVFQVKVGRKYSVNLDVVQSAMLQLPSSGFTDSNGNQYEQIVITAEYFSFKNIGRYQMIAKQGQIPNPGDYDYIRSKSANGFTQLLQLDPPSNPNSSYYILLQGQANTRINFTIRPTVKTNPQLSLNQTRTYITTSPITYTLSTPIPLLTENTTILPLTISLYAYRGYGIFNIDYCNGLFNQSFVSLDGESGEFVIGAEDREQCFYLLEGDEGGMLIQNVVVEVADVLYQFGYSIGVYEGVVAGYLVVGVKQIGVLEGLQDIDTYDIAVYGNNTPLSLTAQVYQGGIQIQIESCSKTSKNTTKCSSQTSLTLQKQTSGIQKTNFTCLQNQICKLTVTPLSTTSLAKYSLLLNYRGKQSTQLVIGKPSYDIVQLNAYNYYFINLTELRLSPAYNFSNATTITIKNSVINGQTVMLASTTIQYPKYNDMFKDNDVQYGFQGLINYITNGTSPDVICISILGDMQSIYQLQFTVNTSANIPAAYLDLPDNSQTDFTLNKQNPFLLIKYTSHIIPYFITFDPMPSCIRYGNRLPISSQCVPANSMPTIFTDTVVYFNISQQFVSDNAVFKFSVFVNSGQYLLSEDRPVLIACEDSCYELVNVLVQAKNATIIHSGDGSITLTLNNKTSSNSPLTLTCNSPPCQYSLNATLKYGGSMTICFQSSSASQIEWRTNPISLPTQSQSKQFYMRIPHYSDFTSFIFYAQAADLTVYYNLIVLNQDYTNTVDYQYPTSQSYMGVSYGDPLTQIHVVDVDQELIDGNKCKDHKIICIVTLSVSLNSSIEYSSQYINKGLLYYSSNTYQYQISPKYPIQSLKQSYSISYFTHLLNFTRNPTSTAYTIHIQSLSNCRPQIQTQSTYFMINYYTDITLPRIMPGQSRINYRVVANQVCRYSTAITNTGFELVFPNIWEVVKVPVKSTNLVVVYQHTAYQTGFKVVLKEPVAQILVNPVKYTTGSNDQAILVLPSMQSNEYIAYSRNSTTVSVPIAQNGQYLISIQLANPSNHPTIPVLVQLQQHSIVLLHNQEVAYTYDPTDNSISAQNNPKIVYDYYSTNKFYVFATVNKISLKITVRDAEVWGESGIILQKTLTNQSDPWIYVDVDGGSENDDWTGGKKTGLDVMTHYKIQCQFLGTLPSGSKATLKMHVQEVGVSGLMEVYEGVSIYDAFVHENALNCYKFVSPMILGQQTLDIDITFMSDIIQSPTSNQSSQYQPTLRSIASLSPGSTTSTPPVHQVLRKISSRTYRQTISFYAASTYKLCFILQNPQMIGVQFSLVVNSPVMPMIYNDQYENQSMIYGDQYDVFEYINYGYQGMGWGNGEEEGQGQRVLLTVVNCLGESSILGSSSYADVTTGKMTDLQESFNSNGVVATLSNIKHGYFYLGVRAMVPAFPQLFRLSVQPVPSTTKQIPQSQFAIDWSRKSSIKTTKVDNTEYVVLRIPPVVRLQSLSALPSSTKYSLYLLNLRNSTNSTKYLYSIDAYTRCPYLFTINVSIFNKSENDDVKQFKPVQVVTKENGPAQEEGMVEFTLPIAQFQKQSNISIKAEVYLAGAEKVYVQYYYGQAQILVYDQQGSSLWKPIKWIFALATMIVGIAGCAFLVRAYLRRRGANVEFEMSDVGRELQNRAPQQNTGPVPAEPVRPNTQQNQNNDNQVTSNRRPLNTNVGYGQFIDEVV